MNTHRKNLMARIFGSRGAAIARTLSLGAAVTLSPIGAAARDIVPFIPQDGAPAVPAVVVEDADPSVEQLMLSVLQPMALDAAADQLGGSDGLSILHSAVLHYAHSATDVYTYKVADDARGEYLLVALNEQGEALDLDQVEQDEAAAYAAKFGKLDAKLHATVQGAADDERITVAIWVNVAEDFAPERPDPDGKTPVDIDGMFERNDAVCREQIAAAIAPVVQAMEGMNIAFETNEFVPVIHADLTKSEIDAVAALAEVQRVYEEFPVEQLQAISRITSRMNLAETNWGARGTNTRVGIVEVGGDVQVANPFLAGRITRLTNRGFLDAHGTAVAGVIGSSHSSTRGFAPNCRMFCGSGTSWAELESVANACFNNLTHLINCSFGGDQDAIPADGFAANPTAIDKVYDTLVYNRVRPVVVACGNNSGIWGNRTQNCISPALGYNVISVGSYDTWNTTSWTGDTMSDFSSFRNPRSLSFDRQKPEIAAPGGVRPLSSAPFYQGLSMLSTANPWLGNVNMGTSFAAPAVAGTAATMLGQNILNLPGWPEAVKAILMCTAMHNIEGDARLSDRDGAGGMDSLLAVQVAQRTTTGNWGGFSYDCTQPVVQTVGTAALVAGKRTRVCVTWLSNPNDAAYADRPSTDLDLRLVAPNGTLIFAPFSIDNTFEIADFTPTISGTYQIQVVRFRCTSSPRAVGWAWYRVP